MNAQEAKVEALSRAGGVIESYLAEGALYSFYQDRPETDVYTIEKAVVTISNQLNAEFMKTYKSMQAKRKNGAKR